MYFYYGRTLLQSISFGSIPTFKKCSYKYVLKNVTRSPQLKYSTKASLTGQVAVLSGNFATSTGPDWKRSSRLQYRCVPLNKLLRKSSIAMRSYLLSHEKQIMQDPLCEIFKHIIKYFKTFQTFKRTIRLVFWYLSSGYMLSGINGVSSAMWSNSGLSRRQICFCIIIFQTFFACKLHAYRIKRYHKNQKIFNNYFRNVESDGSPL